MPRTLAKFADDATPKEKAVDTATPLNASGRLWSAAGTPRLPGLTPGPPSTARPRTAIDAATQLLKVTDRHHATTARTYFKNSRDGVQHYNRLQGMQDSFENSKTKSRLQNQFKDIDADLKKALKISNKCLSDLVASKCAQAKQLQLCNWRLEQRDGRPPKEQLNDSLQQALTSEQQSLVKAQQLLKEQISQVKQNLDGLQKNSEELHEKGFVSDKPGVFLPDVPEAHGTAEEEDDPGHEIGKELLCYLDEQKMTLRKFFQSIDDGNGRIEKHEWIDGLRSIRYSNDSIKLRRVKDCQELFGCVDEDMTGSISWKELQQYFDELLKVARSKHPVGKELITFLKEGGMTLRKLWQAIDDGADGKLEIDEFLLGMQNVGFMNESHPHRNTSTCKEFFLSTDTDRSGIISWHEFQSVISELQNGARCSKVKKLNQVATKKLHKLKDLQRNTIVLRDKSHEMIRMISYECSLNLRHVTTAMNKQVDDLSNKLRKLKFLQSQTELRLKNQLRLLEWKDQADVGADDDVTPRPRGGRQYAESPDLIQEAHNMHQVPAEEIDKDHALAVLDGMLEKLNADVQDKMHALVIDQNCQMAKIIGDQQTLKPAHKTGPGDSQGSFASTSDTVRSLKEFRKLEVT